MRSWHRDVVSLVRVKRGKKRGKKKRKNKKKEIKGKMPEPKGKQK